MVCFIWFIPVFLLAVPENKVVATEPTFTLPHRGCFYSAWSAYRPGKARFLPRHVDASLCTIFYYAFAEIKLDNSVDPDMSSLRVPRLSILKSSFGFLTKSGGSAFTNVSLTVTDTAKELTFLKRKNPSLKMVISVGGSEASQKLSDVAASTNLRKYFIASAITLIRDLGYDGLDVSWKHFGQADFVYFTHLITEIQAAFHEETMTSSLPRLIFTATVGNLTMEGYNIPLMAKALDLLNIESYDLYNPSSELTTTGHPSALFAPKSNPAAANVKDFVGVWERFGIPKSKIVVGLAAYGNTWKLVDNNGYGLNASAAGPAPGGIYTKTPGFLAYYEICDKIHSGELTPVLESDTKTPYAYSMSDKWWVGYDDEASIREKVKWTKSKGYGGVFLWEITFDDFIGNCGIKYPLLHAIQEAFKSNDETK